MCQITQLETFINQYRDYSEVAEEAYRINPDWREQTWTRGLRRSLKIEAVYKDNKPNSPIIGYKPKNIPKGQIKPKFNALWGRLECLDDQITEIQKKIPVSWENMEIHKELTNALKSNNVYLKESIIRKYDKS